MPMRPPHPCSKPGCAELVHERFCHVHALSQERRERKRRGKTAERGYGARHRRWRKAVLRAAYGLCAMCLEVGKTTAATVADHIIPISHGGARFDMSNGQALCATCHSGQKQREDIAARASL